MTFLRDALRDKPYALYMMDDTTPFQDHSSYARTGISVGTAPITHPSLVKGAAFAQVFNSSATAKFDAPVFKQGYEKSNFTLEATIRPIRKTTPTTAAQQILSHSGIYDGLSINGTVVSFGTSYLTAPAAVVSYDLQQDRAVVLHGVHTANKNSLYVDGLLVSEITLTDVQQADSFVATDGFLYSGGTTSNQNLALQGVGMYSYALPSESILRHANMARNVPNGGEVVNGKGGDYIQLSLSNSDLFLDQWWSTADDWNAAQLFNTAVKSDQLVPQFDITTGLSLAGSWYDTFGMDNSGATSIYGVSINWDGTGATVAASLDGTTWETAVRGRRLALIPAGYNPTNKELQLRITFPGGIANDTSFVDNLNVVGLKTGVPPLVGGRTVTFSGGDQERDHMPLEYHDNWGAELAAGGTIVISADTSGDASVVRTLEVWIKATTATNPTVSATGTSYRDGVAASTTLVTGQWTLFHVVASADITGAVTITGPAQVGQVGIYNTALTAGDIAAIYATYVGTNVLTVADSAVLGVTETTPPVKIYAADWAIQPTG